MEQQTKEYYMKRAIEIAKTAMGHTSPNPMVGCVVVKDGKIISEACHERCGEYHAERNALLRCSEDTTGAQLFVTLEPCCHHGKTPPCTDIIIEKKISKVYVGSLDSNPLVGGKGIKILRDAGIEVETGILEEECLEMNDIFFHYIENNNPLVALKYAMTLDGKICTKTGDSKWITGESAREHVHYLRKKYSSILVGIQTVLADNPMLNCRIEDGVDPIRIICDTSLRIPMDCDIVKTAKSIRTIVVCGENASDEKEEQLTQFGIEVMRIVTKNNHIDVNELVKTLGMMKIDSILVEGGSMMHGAFIDAGIVDKVYCYIAPKIPGGDGKSPVGGNGVELMNNAIGFSKVKTITFGNDTLIECIV